MEGDDGGVDRDEQHGELHGQLREPCGQQRGPYRQQHGQHREPCVQLHGQLGDDHGGGSHDDRGVRGVRDELNFINQT